MELSKRDIIEALDTAEAKLSPMNEDEVRNYVMSYDMSNFEVNDDVKGVYKTLKLVLTDWRMYSASDIPEEFAGEITQEIGGLLFFDELTAFTLAKITDSFFWRTVLSDLHSSVPPEMEYDEDEDEDYDPEEEDDEDFYSDKENSSLLRNLPDDPDDLPDPDDMDFDDYFVRLRF